MSLRRALQIRLLVPVAVLLLFSSALAYALTRHYAGAIYDSWLYNMAHTVALEVGEDGPEVVHTAEIDQQLRNWKEGDRQDYAITVDGRLIAGNGDLPPAPRTARPYGPDAALYDAERGGKSLRLIVLHAPATERRPALEVRVAEDRARRDVLARRVGYTVALPAVFLIGIAGLLIRLTVRGSLAGLDELTQRLGAHPEGEALAIDASRLPRELRQMTMAFAGLVERNNSLLLAQRRFVANAAHQLRSPMAATELHLDGVEHAGTEAQRKASLAQLRRAVERTNRLAQQLLSLARLEPGTRPTIPMAPVDLVETVRASGADYVPLAINKGIDIELDVPEAMVRVRGNALLLGEAIANLIDNAVRYHPGGGNIRLAVDTVGPRARIVIADDGPGVSTALAQRLFTRFAQGDNSTGEGAGLGLAIVREIVELHGASVHAEPGDDGRGLRITIELPLVAEAAAQAADVVS